MIDYQNGILAPAFETRMALDSVKIEYWDGEKWRDMNVPILQMNVISPKRFRLIRISE
jgi:hypothetical protein